MHQKHIKPNFLQHHSIPICLARGIPIGCMVALLLIIGTTISPTSYSNKTYAVEVGDSSEESIDDKEDTDNNHSLSTYAVTSVNPTASLTIGGDATNKQVITSPGSVGYRSHTVTVEASDIESYSLTISGPSNLTSGTFTTVSGAGNKTPANMSNNTWGYSWGGDNKESVSYQTILPSGSNLAGDRVSSFNVSFTRNLFFAAKFGEDATPGRYRANVTLSLTATPRAVATGFASISDMQQMAPEICAAAKVGDTGSLEDIRDGNVYTVAKLSDGNCWMTQNLRLEDGAVMNRTNTDLDPTVYVTDAQTYTLPPASSAFSNLKMTDSAGIEAYMNHQVYNPTNNADGFYYSWCAAAAGTCQVGTYANIQPKLNSSDGVYYTAAPASTTSIVTNNTNVSSSICPKGWRISTGGNSGNLQALYNIYPNKAPSGFAIENGRKGHWLGGDSIANGGMFIPAAGFIDEDGLRGFDYGAELWTGTAYNGPLEGYPSGTGALFLYSTPIILSPTGVYYRYAGFPVRCVAR